MDSQPSTITNDDHDTPIEGINFIGRGAQFTYGGGLYTVERIYVVAHEEEHGVKVDVFWEGDPDAAQTVPMSWFDAAIKNGGIELQGW